MIVVSAWSVNGNKDQVFGYAAREGPRSWYDGWVLHLGRKDVYGLAIYWGLRLSTTVMICLENS